MFRSGLACDKVVYCNIRDAYRGLLKKAKKDITQILLMIVLDMRNLFRTANVSSQ